MQVKKVEINLRKLINKGLTIFGVDFSTEEIKFCDISLGGHVDFIDWLDEYTSDFLPEKYIYTECEQDEMISDINEKLIEMVIESLPVKNVSVLDDVREYEAEHEDNPNLN